MDEIINLIEKNWAYKILNTNKFKNLHLKIFLFFFLPAVILLLVPFLFRVFSSDNYSMFTFIALMIALSWVYLGPWMIYLYYEGLKTFYKYLYSNIETKKNILNKIFKENREKSKKLIRFVSALWVLIVISALIIKPELLNKYLFSGYVDVLYYFLILCLIIVLCLNAIGISEIISSIILIYKLSNNDELMTDLLDDNILSIRSFGNYIFLISKCFISGIVFFPILSDFISESNIIYSIGVICAICCYVTLILLAFFVPYFHLEKISSKMKNKIVDKAEENYNRLLKRKETDTFYELKKVNAYNYLQHVKSIDTFPTGIKKIIMVFSGAIIPGIVFLVENFSFISKIYIDFF